MHLLLVLCTRAYALIWSVGSCMVVLCVFCLQVSEEPKPLRNIVAGDREAYVVAKSVRLHLEFLCNISFSRTWGFRRVGFREELFNLFLEKFL